MGIGWRGQQEIAETAVVGTTEGVGSLVSPDLGELGRIALADRKLRASCVDGWGWAHQAEDRCGSLELEDYLGEL